MNYESLKPKELKILADTELRKYLLNSTPSRNSYYFCPLKKGWYHESKMHVAHFFDRSKMSTRYDLINCHLISESSNSYDAQIVIDGYKSKHHKEYEDWLIFRYGKEEIESLKLKSESLEVFTKDDYINAIIRLRDGK